MPSTTEGVRAPESERIPPQPAAQIRALLHDLSNALEIVVQSEYLLSTAAEAPELSKEWLGLLDKGTQQAIQLNKQLREYVRAHS
ncbi:MAG TPA: hypothetical protein VHX63_17200 [Acidobacteriaceae bacterium]|jgi:hypothetical protein|nr:hypothetical protein [Acidobacteriaceae bacterium]